MRYPRIVDDVVVHAVPKKYGDVYHDDKGYGIYARRAYRRGELIARVKGVRRRDTDARLSSRAIQVGKHLFLDPNRFSLFWYLNHSCVPSAYVDMDKLIARRDIKTGEELTADYSLFTDFPLWDMDCRCGEGKCRKRIVSYSLLKPKPKTFISSYLAR